MDLQKLRYFTVLADELHFGQAASRLFMSQSALSTAIRTLERSLGVELFHRTSRHVDLTAAGRDLLPLAQQVLAHADLLLSTVRDDRGVRARSTTLRLAFVGQAANELTPVLIDRFTRRNSSVDVALRQVSTSDVTSVLREDEADVAIVRLPLGPTVGLEVHRLFEEDRVAVLPADHEAADRAEVALADLLEQPWVVASGQDDAQRRFATAQDRRDGRPLRLGATVANLDEYLEAISAHQGIGLAPVSASRYYARPGIAFVPVPDAEPSVVALAWSTASVRGAGWGAELLELARHLLAVSPVPGTRTAVGAVPAQRA